MEIIKDAYDLAVYILNQYNIEKARIYWSSNKWSPYYERLKDHCLKTKRNDLYQAYSPDSDGEHNLVKKNISPEYVSDIRKVLQQCDELLGAVLINPGCFYTLNGEIFYFDVVEELNKPYEKFIGMPVPEFCKTFLKVYKTQLKLTPFWEKIKHLFKITQKYIPEKIIKGKMVEEIDY